MPINALLDARACPVAQRFCHSQNGLADQTSPDLNLKGRTSTTATNQSPFFSHTSPFA